MKSNIGTSWTRGFYLLVAFCIPALAHSAQAQVGHRPDASPYRHSNARRVFGVHAGYLWGDLGEAGVGPSNGPVLGGNFDMLFDGPAALSFNVWYGGLERFVKNPGLPRDERTTGPFSQQMLALDGNVQFVLTGSKSWHRIAPYVGFGIGLSFDSNVPQDSTGFAFGTKFLLQPAFGLRLYLSDRLILTAEGKDSMWRLSYPQTYLTATDPILDPLLNKANEWTHHFVARFGLGYAWRMN